MQKSIHTARYRVLLGLLAKTRQAAGVTQAQLAKRLRTTQSMVSKAENGERRLDVIELHSWCWALGKRFKDFADELDDELVALQR